MTDAPRDCATCARLSEEYAALADGRTAALEDAVAHLRTMTAGLSGQVADLQRRIAALEDVALSVPR